MTSLASLLYISTSAVESGNEERELRDIVDCAARHNSDLDVTGALIFTGRNFAQALEGPRRSVDELMAAISRDRRHQDIRTIPVEQVGSRRFDGWSLAYAGPSLFIAREVSGLLEESDKLEPPSKLLRLMQGFASEGRLTA